MQTALESETSDGKSGNDVFSIPRPITMQNPVRLSRGPWGSWREMYWIGISQTCFLHRAESGKTTETLQKRILLRKLTCQGKRGSPKYQNGSMHEKWENGSRTEMMSLTPPSSLILLAMIEKQSMHNEPAIPCFSYPTTRIPDSRHDFPRRNIQIKTRIKKKWRLVFPGEIFFSGNNLIQRFILK